MGKRLQPDYYYESAFAVDYRALYERGIRGIIFDIDNTLVLPDAPADARSRELFARLKSMGFATMIMSNNTGTRARVFAQDVGSPVVTGAWKPFPGRYRDALQIMGTDAAHTAAVGDQIYTDVWGANNAGLVSVLTVPMTYAEPFWIRAKRVLEKPVIGNQVPLKEAPEDGTRDSN